MLVSQALNGIEMTVIFLITRVRNLLWKTGENARESEQHSKGRCVRVCVNKYDYYLNIAYMIFVCLTHT